MNDSVPVAGAAAIVFDDHGRVLLVKENYGRHRWSLPGGAIEQDETPEEAVIRETLEETGLVVGIDHLVGEYRLDDDFTVFAFSCTVTAGTSAVLPTGEIAAVTWHPANDLPHPRSNVLHYAVPDALAGHRDRFRRVRRLMHEHFDVSD
ncbi:MAG: NUDIX hydrolase [Gaiella sp.]